MSSDNIQVAVKSRPLLHREEKENLRPQWVIQDKVIFQTDENGHRISEPYGFDHIFTEDTTNAYVYNAVVDPLVKSFLNGFNSTIFAYGQTSSGKTHTMMGTEDTTGIIQMAVNDIFRQVSQDSQRRYLLSCSYFEIYNEKINDLLDKNGEDIKIREDCYGNTFVNSKEEVVTELSQVFELMKMGSKIRKIGCTNMNERSSRSHTIFRFTIKSTENNVEHGPVQISHLNLVDLAGSERVAHTKAEGVRRKEGVNINKSLLALGNVIRQLSEGEGFINYRDSNLTRLLQNALGGNARSLIIATITLAAGEETKSTLEFAQKAKVVRNKPVINEILSEQDKVRQYKLVTASYKERLQMEQQRILEMEQEKEEREREIMKLKQQVKLIDLFNNGPEKKKFESRVPRRHTMGSYTVAPLPTIPEARALSPSDAHEKLEDDDELFLNVASRASEGNYVKIEQLLDDDILAVTPEPPEETMIQDQGTPESQLRMRLKHLEESYMSLKEFTKLEAEFKEDKNVVSELVKEKENLMKEVVDLNVLIKDARREKEEIKEKMHALTEDFELQKQKVDQLAFALDQAESEKDRLRVLKEQLLNDNEVLLEEQRLKYENQLQYFINEIERLNNLEREKGKVDYNFEEEIRRLREENESNKSNLEKISTYEQKIVELQGKLQEFERGEEDILSVATQTEKDAALEMREILATKIREMQNLQEENKIHKQINIILKEETCVRDRIITELNNTIKSLEKINFSNGNELENKQEEISKLNDKIKDLEKEHRNTINSNNKQVSELKTKIENLEKSSTKLKSDFYNAEIQSRDVQISELTAQIKDLKKQNKEQGQHKDNQILELTNKVKEYERSKDLSQEEIENKFKEFTTKIKDLDKLHKEEVQQKDNQISELTNIMKEYERLKDLNQQEIENRVKQITELTAKIKDLEKQHEEVQQKDNQILEMTNKIKEYERSKDLSQEEIESRVKEIIELIAKIKDLEKQHEEEVQQKDNQISELTNKIKEYERSKDLSQEEIESRVKEIIELIAKIKDLEKQHEEEVQQKDNQISELTNKIKEYEKTKDRSQEEIESRVVQIVGLTVKIKDLEKHNETAQKQVEEKNEQVLELMKKVEELEKCYYSGVQENYAKSQMIIELTTHVADLEMRVKSKDQEIKDLEECNDVFCDEVNTRDKRILELTRKIEHLEALLAQQKNQTQEWEKVNHKNKTEIYKRDNQILILTEKTRYLKETNVSNKDEISELKHKIEKMEKDSQATKDEIQRKKAEILELSNKVKDLTEKLEGKKTRLSSASSSTDFSPRELRKRKRHSIQDQRRGIDFSAANEDEPTTQSVSETEEELQEKIKAQEAKIEWLTEENKHLEWEVQGFISELDDMQRYKQNDNEEIEMLKKQLEEANKGGGDCKECIKKLDHIKKMESAQKENLFRIVDLQTKVYELQNQIQDKACAGKFSQTMRVQERGKTPPKLVDAAVQCDIMNHEQLLEKYSKMKKLARMRRNEANILRARLGMDPDEPVTDAMASNPTPST